MRYGRHRWAIPVFAMIMVACGDRPVDEIKGVSVLTEVFGDGQKSTAAVVEYEDIISNASLGNDAFEVEGRTITRVYSNYSPEKVTGGVDGPYVVIELSPDDADAPVLISRGGKRYIRRPQARVRQLRDIMTPEERLLKPTGNVHISDWTINTIVEDFYRTEYLDELTGQTLKYNLFVPHDYDKDRNYPLVLFMHDAGSTSTNTRMTLLQGNGATVWATSAVQAEHPCFVLAPQYSAEVVNGDAEATEYLDITIDLIKEIAAEYSIDPNRIYATGQSGGCMLAIAMNIAYPGFFAASYLVAGQWDAQLVGPIAGEKLWIMVSEGDRKAFPGMNAITDILEQRGVRVARAVWSGRWNREQFRKAVEEMIREKAPVNYTVLEKGTVVPPGMDDDHANNHISTWQVAYDIEGIRDWLLRQVRGEAVR